MSAARKTKTTPSEATSGRRRRNPGDAAVGLGLGLFLGGLAGFAMGAALSEKQQLAAPPPPPRYVLGGVDLTGVDLTQPFWVDFALPTQSSTEIKRLSLGRLRVALQVFQQAHPDWFCEILGSVDSDVFGLRVTPLGAMRRALKNT